MHITKKLCERLDGEIRVYSRPNIGTTFMICLKTRVGEHQFHENDPNPNSNQSGSVGQATNAVLESHTLRAMIIDDNPYNADLNRKYLERANINVAVVCRNGQDALDKYKAAYEEKRPFNIITVDLDMPLLDSKAAIERIR
mmetsp:Transcript_12907/g.11034  ORF Transcript_12907/g.11034 Transcript_12907/m.11034 type:complete len:141 (+) Transcript_12907:1547-1969(+)